MIYTETDLLAELASLEAKPEHKVRINYLRWLLCLDTLTTPTQS